MRQTDTAGEPGLQSFALTTSPAFGARHLPRIRAVMAAQGLDALVIPHEDEHQNEYLPEANDRLAWATGFTGSAGAAVVAADRCVLFVDGRYTVQGRAQTDPAAIEVRDLVAEGPAGWLRRKAVAGWRIGYDPRLHSPDALWHLQQAAEAAGAQMTPVDPNPVDAAWGAERPAQPKAAVVPHPLEFTGEDSAAKRERLGRALAEHGADAAVLTAPASLAWLLNIRGGDVIRTPLPLGQAVLGADGAATVLLDPDKVTEDLPAFLGNQVSLERPERLAEVLGGLRGKRVLLDPSASSAWWFDALQAAGAVIVRGQDPAVLPRAQKNAVELEGSREAHRRDGAAMVRFLHWLATDAKAGKLPTEIEAAQQLEQFRKATGALRDLSFDSISAAGPNGALPHYRVNTETNRRLERGSLYLIDSGGQYLDGTTDITRTVAIGQPTAEMVRAATLVLKANLALTRARFPEGTTGHQLDALARSVMWSAGLDYAHGTGHGVGSYLGVHEGPARIAAWVNSVPLLPGMIMSNEPGYYREGAFGIRIEMLVAVTPPQPIAGGEIPMMGFEVLTYVPVDKALIDPALLTAEERGQLDAYHAETWARLQDRVDGDARAWLEAACAPL